MYSTVAVYPYIYIHTHTFFLIYTIYAMNMWGGGFHKSVVLIWGSLLGSL